MGLEYIFPCRRPIGKVTLSAFCKELLPVGEYEIYSSRVFVQKAYFKSGN
jgi:hypothetical protein